MTKRLLFLILIAFTVNAAPVAAQAQPPVPPPSPPPVAAAPPPPPQQMNPGGASQPGAPSISTPGTIGTGAKPSGLPGDSTSAPGFPAPVGK